MTSKDASPIPMPWNGPAEFPSRLRGIRHLKRISAANLRLPGEQVLYNAIFTLHKDTCLEENEAPFYTSEVVYESTNPSWCAFNDDLFQNGPPSTEKKLIVCVWETSDRVPRRLLLKNRIDLGELAFLSTMNLEFPDNSLLFDLQDGIYTTKSVRIQFEESNIITRSDNYVDEDNTKRLSCSRETYLYILNKKKELKQKQEKIKELTQKIEDKRQENANYFEKMEERNEYEDRLASLQAQYQIVLNTYNKKKAEIEQRSQTLIPTAEKLHEAQLALQSSIQEMEQRKRELIAHHQQLTKNCFLIRKHQERLIRDLSNIYRIQPVKDTIHGTEKQPYVSAVVAPNSPNRPILYAINGFPLNNSQFHGYDEEKIATGLGYVCHLVQLLSKYLDIPLRYPVHPMMSRSTIQDVAVSSDRLPLFSKAQHVEHFREAVALLNRNVEQLVLSQNLEPGSLPETLPNLRILIDAFISSSGNASSSSSSTTATQSSSSAPNTTNSQTSLSGLIATRQDGKSTPHNDATFSPSQASASASNNPKQKQKQQTQGSPSNHNHNNSTKGSSTLPTKVESTTTTKPRQSIPAPDSNATTPAIPTTKQQQNSTDTPVQILENSASSLPTKPSSPAITSLPALPKFD